MQSLVKIKTKNYTNKKDDCWAEFEELVIYRDLKTVGVDWLVPGKHLTCDYLSHGGVVLCPLDRTLQVYMEIISQTQSLQSTVNRNADTHQNPSVQDWPTYI